MTCRPQLHCVRVVTKFASAAWRTFARRTSSGACTDDGGAVAGCAQTWICFRGSCGEGPGAEGTAEPVQKLTQGWVCFWGLGILRLVLRAHSIHVLIRFMWLSASLHALIRSCKCGWLRTLDGFCGSPMQGGQGREVPLLPPVRGAVRPLQQVGGACTEALTTQCYGQAVAGGGRDGRCNIFCCLKGCCGIGAVSAPVVEMAWSSSGSSGGSTTIPALLTPAPRPPSSPPKTFHVCSADPEQVRLLNEANRAAAIAQASRAPGGAAAGPGGGGTGGGGGWGGAATAAADDNWMCGTCRCLNLAHRDECGSCGRANPRGPRPTAITASTRGKDVLKCSDDEVIG